MGRCYRQDNQYTGSVGSDGRGIIYMSNCDEGCGLPGVQHLEVMVAHLIVGDHFTTKKNSRIQPGGIGRTVGG